MGGIDKGLIEIGGEPLWRRVVARLKPQARRLAVVAPVEPAWRAGAGLDHIVDDAPSGERQGPVVALLAALEHLASVAGPGAMLLTAPVDAPFLPPDLGAKLHAARREAGARVSIVREADGPNPVFGLWSVACLADVKRLAAGGERALHRLAKGVGAAECAAWPGVQPNPFFNINTPEDLTEAEALARR